MADHLGDERAVRRLRVEQQLDLPELGREVARVLPLEPVDAVLELGVDNPAMSFNVSGIDGSIRVDEVPFATFTAGELRVEGKKILRYELPCSITLEPGISLLDVLKLSTRRSLDGIKADVNLKVASKNGALKAPLSYKDLDLAEFSK